MRAIQNTENEARIIADVRLSQNSTSFVSFLINPWKLLPRCKSCAIEEIVHDKCKRASESNCPQAIRVSYPRSKMIKITWTCTVHIFSSIFFTCWKTRSLLPWKVPLRRPAIVHLHQAFESRPRWCGRKGWTLNLSDLFFKVANTDQSALQVQHQHACDP